MDIWIYGLCTKGLLIQNRNRTFCPPKQKENCTRHQRTARLSVSDVKHWRTYLYGDCTMTGKEIKIIVRFSKNVNISNNYAATYLVCDMAAFVSWFIDMQWSTLNVGHCILSWNAFDNHIDKSTSQLEAVHKTVVWLTRSVIYGTPQIAKLTITRGSKIALWPNFVL